MIPKLVLATHNKGKVRELESLLGGLVGEVVSAGDLGLPEPEEIGTTFLENATMKAVTAMKACGLPCLADDSGLCVNALNGDPGVYTADWAGVPKDYDRAMALINDKLGGSSDRSAYFMSCIVLAYPDGTMKVFEGKCDGSVVWPPRGTDGFHYDPLFLPDGFDRTFAEMDLTLKNSISHRAKATQKLIDYLTA